MSFRLLLLLSLFRVAPVLADDEQREQCQLAVVEDLAGTVELVSPDGARSALAKDGALQPGDYLYTEENSWADLRLCDGTGLRVGESSKFHYEGADNERESFAAWAFSLLQGTLRAAVVSSGNGDRVKLRVLTRSAALGVRGTEFVVDAQGEGDRETALHTLEGEVLMGSAADYDKLSSLRGAELTRAFEPVAQEKMSVIRANEARPLRAAAFKLWEYRAANKRLLDRPLPKRGWTEIRTRFQNVHRKLKQRRRERPLFDRPREKIEERVEEKRPERALRRQENAAGVHLPPPAREPNQDAEQAPAKPFREERREKRLEQKLQKNKQKEMDKRLRKGWRQNQNNQPESPRKKGWRLHQEN